MVFPYSSAPLEKQLLRYYQRYYIEIQILTLNRRHLFWQLKLKNTEHLIQQQGIMQMPLLQFVKATRPEPLCDQLAIMATMLLVVPLIPLMLNSLYMINGLYLT